MLNLIAPWEVPGALTLVDELVDGCYAALGRWIGNGAVHEVTLATTCQLP